MQFFASGLAERGMRVVRFEFPYMAQRRQTGSRRPPDREPVLRQTWADVVQALDTAPLILGGKSMGGRIASLVADSLRPRGLICMGYPFHPTGKPERLRVEHLQEIQTPTLIVQGERDPFGSREDVATYRLSANVKMHWLADGNHDFKPRRASGKSQQDNWTDALNAIDRFVARLIEPV